MLISIHYVSGNGANAEEKRVALQMADNFIEQMKYPRMKTQVLLICQHTCHRLLQQLVIISNDHLQVWTITYSRFTVTSLCIQYAIKVNVHCAAGGDSATGEGDHHLQTILQELELNISWEHLHWRRSCISENRQHLIQDIFHFFICI